MDIKGITERALAGQGATAEEAKQLLSYPDEDWLEVVAAAAKVRRKFFGRSVKLNYLVNLRSGKCPEDCHYCSQRLNSEAGVLNYSWLTSEETAEAVDAGIAAGASRVCLVASGRGPSNRDVDRVADMVEEAKLRNPSLEVCACLGFIDDEKAKRLREAGVDAYNHNLNTAESHYPEICSTHDYADREKTVDVARSQGMSACSGLIAGLGETDEQLVEVVAALRDLGVDSVPVNFLLPFDGTPLAGQHALTAPRCLIILAMVRLMCPDVEVRAAAGREQHLGTLQPIVLEVANSIFLGDYLTSEGQASSADLEMIAELGWEIVGAPTSTEGADQGRPVPVRRRGVGTDLAPNA